MTRQKYTQKMLRLLQKLLINKMSKEASLDESKKPNLMKMCPKKNIIQNMI